MCLIKMNIGFRKFVLVLDISLQIWRTDLTTITIRQVYGLIQTNNKKHDNDGISKVRERVIERVTRLCVWGGGVNVKGGSSH